MRNENELKNSGIRAARPVPVLEFYWCKGTRLFGPGTGFVSVRTLLRVFYHQFQETTLPDFPD